MRALIVGLVVLAIVVGLVVWGVGINNQLVRLEQGVNETSAQVQNVYQRRADLIPNLVETVQGYATHEREVLDQITAHRADAVKAGSVSGTAAADAQMTGLLGRLMAVAEAYPDLKANTNFLQLQSELSDIENKLAAARRFFNNAISEFNAAIQQFPAVLLAGALGFKERAFFDLGENRAALNTAP